MKKGQIEMIGLVIVVVLLIVGGLFYITFSLKSKKTNDQDLHIQSITANNLVNAIVKIKICENVSVSEGISRCDKNNDLCGQNACEFLKDKLKIIIENVTDQNYLFYVNKGDNELLSVGSCDYGVSSVPYRLDIDSTSYDVGIKLCNKDSTE